MQPRLRMLGTPKLEHLGTVTDLSSDRPLSLAFYLLVRGDWVRRVELAYLYYPDSDESMAFSNLRKLIHRLKQQPWAASLESDQTRLRLLLPTDVQDFRDALNQKNYARALECYDGTFLENVSFPDLVGFEAWLELERQDLFRAWRFAVLEHARSLAERQVFAKAESWLSRVLTFDPLDEEVLQAQLRVLLSAGERHRALEVFEQFKLRLKRELDSLPLALTKDILDDAQSSEVKSELKAALRHNLPTPTTRFVGRLHELAQFSAYINNLNCRLLTVVGLGGMGKTRLVLEGLTAHVEDFQDGVWFVPLVGVDSLELMISSIAAVLSLTFSGSSSTREQLFQFLFDKRLVLFLDNFEQLKAHSFFLEDLLSKVAGVQLVVTSRVVLELGSEWLFDLVGLTFPPLETQDLTETQIRSFDALQLFIGHAERLSNSFITDANTLQAIARLCHNVQGMPLALELAVVWTRSIGVFELVNILSKSFELLKTNHQDSFARQRNLSAILNYTWALLTPSEQGVLSKLSVIRGGFTLEAASTIAGAHLGFLLRFINLALVRRNHDGRFDLHELVRQFAFSQLDQPDQELALLECSRYFMDFLVIQGKTLRSKIQRDTLLVCRSEISNILDSIEFMVSQNQLAALDDALIAFSSLIEMLGLYDVGVKRIDLLLEKHELDALFAGKLLAILGYFLVKIGKDEQALTSSAKSIQMLQTEPMSNFMGIAFYSQGILNHFSGQYQDAIVMYRKALKVFKSNDNQSEMCRIYNRIAVVYQNQNNIRKSNRFFHTALELSKISKDSSEMGIIYNNYGINFESTGEVEKAIEMYSQAAKICEEIGYLRGLGAALTNLGHVNERKKDYESARTFYEKSIEVKKVLGEPLAMSISMTNLADVLYQLGEHNQANEINLKTLTMTSKSNAFMYAARVIWSFTKFFALKNRMVEALYLAHFLSSFNECEQWVRDEAHQFLSQHAQNASSTQPQPSFQAITDWLNQPNRLA